MPGYVAGVIELDGAEFAPNPALVRAATRKMYAVPLVRPVTVALELDETPSTKVRHVVPPFDEKAIT